MHSLVTAFTGSSLRSRKLHWKENVDLESSWLDGYNKVVLPLRLYVDITLHLQNVKFTMTQVPVWIQTSHF